MEVDESHSTLMVASFHIVYEGSLLVTDTIAALATATGRGGVGIIRVSGAAVPEIAQAMLGFMPKARYAHHAPFLAADGATLDVGIALYFPNPHSFTGEDVLELQGHGGPVVMNWLLTRVCALGARLARPGEFSERAFLNDKLDLAQAEAIADLIAASSEAAARSALSSLQGAFSSEVNALVESLILLRLYVEAAIDFPEEEIDFLGDGIVQQRLAVIVAAVDDLCSRAQQGARLRDGIRLVIAGQPNAGKSSLLNALTRQETAIVTDIAGTTRDVLREEIDLNGLPVQVLDTAGLRETDDPVERIGVQRAWDAISKADHALFLLDSRKGWTDEDTRLRALLPASLPVTLVWNKQDAVQGHADIRQDEDGETSVYLSAKTGEGMDGLRDYLARVLGVQHLGEGLILARARHVDALTRAQAALARGQHQLLVFHAGELLAEEMRLAQDALSEITGAFRADDLLGRIFSEFCIGK
jgi:tRNA modification GTPase